MGWIANRYELKEHLGQGDLADAHAAIDRALEEEVVLKVLRADRDPEALIREHAALRSCSHPSLVRARDFGWAHIGGSRRPFYVADRVAGPTLDRWAESKPEWRAVRAVLVDLARALFALHRAGLRHGDVKPDNIRIAEGRAVLLDLSCAAEIGAASASISGTLRYLAPELRTGRAADGRADLYALGLTWSELPERGPPELDAFRASLCREDPGERPADANAVLEALGADVEVAPHTFVPLLGRSRELARFDAFVRALAERAPGDRVLSFEGPHGCGQSRLLREMLWRAQRAVTTTEGFALRRAEPVRDLLSRAAGRAIGPGLAPIASAIDELAAREEPHLLVLDDAHRMDEAERALLRAALAMVPAEGSLAVLTTLPREGSVPLEGLDAAAIARWIASIGAPHVDPSRLIELTGGRPAEVAPRLERALRGEAWALARAVEVPASAPREMREAIALASWLDAGLRAKDAALVGISEPILHRASAEGWLRDENGGWRASAIAVGDDLSAIAERALAHLAIEGPSRARLCLRAGLRAEAEALAASWASDPRAWLSVLDALAEDGTDADRVRLARAALRAGDARRAGIALDGCRAAELSDDLSLERELAIAEHGLKTGHTDAVVAALARAARIDAGDLRIADLEARAELALVRYEAAERIARGAAERAHDPELVARLRETEGLAAGYRGDPRADAILVAARDAHRAAHDAAGEVRIATCRGILAQRRGEMRGAIAAYRDALAIAERHAVDDALARSWLNLGAALTEDGDWGGALDAYAQGLRYAVVLEQWGIEASLRFNLANLYLEIGAWDRAQVLWDRAEVRCRELGYEHLAAPLARLAGEIAWRRGESKRAERAFSDAAARYTASGASSDAREVALLSAEHALDEARLEDAQRWLGEETDAHPALDRVLRARLALARGDALGAIRTAEHALESAPENRIAARARSLLALAFEARGADALARANASEARARWERIAATLPAELRAAFAAHPHRARSLSPPAARASDPSRLGAASLRRFLSVNRRLISSLDAAQVLEHAMDAAVELTEAERGFVLLRRGSALEVAAARNLDRERIPESHLKFSHSIAERVIDSGEPVVTVDARADARFREERSVHAMRLQSVACVPIRSAEGVRGALYLDNRFERGRFADEDLELLQAFADQVAIALRNAELHAALAERTRALDEARAALESRVEGQAARIADLASEVEKRQRALEYRYDYDRIVGRGPAMRRVLDTLERVIGSDLSVLVRGESGTGKELVAKAIHYNGARRDRPMVSLNCAALPQALIESELFGHKRGAFTGADRDAPGLLVEADGGTVFLDELGEMPLGAQAKLLRALEEREVRPVGGTKNVPFDVRLVAATNRDLAADVKEGRFREDLYYRISVIAIELPPLRERDEDLAELCTALLRELGGARLTEGAFAALREHRWPGNVRELRNVLARASVLAHGDRIDRADLALDIEPRSLPGDRTSFETSEAERIRRALVACGWNVCRVSRELGIPRQTLYRKMKQHALHRAR